MTTWGSGVVGGGRPLVRERRINRADLLGSAVRPLGWRYAMVVSMACWSASSCSPLEPCVVQMVKSSAYRAWRMPGILSSLLGIGGVSC